MTLDSGTRVLVRVDAGTVLGSSGETALIALWDTGRVDAIVLGRSATGDADPSAVAAFLGARHPRLDLVIEAGFDHDFPYNLARRVASLQALGGRAPALLLHPAGAGGDRDGVDALHRLWQSWPRTSILGDRETRTFVDVEQLRRVDQAGRHRVAGPLQTPVDQDDLPVVLQHFDPAAPDESADADVLVTDAAGAARAEAADRRPVFIETAASAVRLVVESGADGVIVDDEPDAVRRALDPLPRRGGGGLRGRWGLGRPRVTLDDGVRPFAPSRGHA
ncbi:MAG: hypothetical protein QM626_14870 [Microbacterium sp.]|uniref:hypothetical protein n=1 Tax=Microbacterium sp. TaxID=51671 RepID=UPI0039E3B908